LKPGYKNIHTTEAISKALEEHKVNAVEGVLSHDLNKWLIDGNNVILNKDNFEARVEEHEYAVHEVYALDIIVSTGEGKTRETELRTTVYKRALERAYNLKTKHGRAFFHTLSEKFPALCFSTRNFEDEISTKLGVAECLKHDLLNGYPVLTEKKGEVVAHFKYTVAIMPKQTLILAGLPVDLASYKPDNKITDERLIALLNTSISKTKK
jgi:methionine aminopeptidase